MSEKLYREVRDCIVQHSGRHSATANEASAAIARGVLSELADIIAYEIDQTNDLNEFAALVMRALQFVVGDLHSAAMRKNLRLEALERIERIIEHEQERLRTEPIEAIRRPSSPWRAWNYD